MAWCLIALGSNLGDRAGQLRQAVGALARLPHTLLAARSAWRETPPVGGPPGQGPFLNGAALVATALSPATLLEELARVEERLGRVRLQRWEARAIDLDVLLYNGFIAREAAVTVPHPRMAFRRFVLEPAAEVASWMLHPDSGWTISRLLENLHRGVDQAAVAAADAKSADRLIVELSRCVPPTDGAPVIIRWRREDLDALPTQGRPKLLLAATPATGSDRRQWRKMLHLPDDGPVAWVDGDRPDEAFHEALAAIQSVWPELVGR